MYYNIKIKSNGSEFSLESTNKEVTQREMDMYFALIFDASDDFKSKLKKIEIVDNNVKSINEIEQATPKTQIQQPIEPTTQTPVQMATQPPIQTIVQQPTQVAVQPKIETKVQTPVQTITQAPVEIVTQAPIQQAPLPCVSLTNGPTQSAIAPTPVQNSQNIQNGPIPTVTINNIQTNAIQIEQQVAPIIETVNEIEKDSQNQKDIDELIKLAQDKLNSMETDLAPVELNIEEQATPNQQVIEIDENVIDFDLSEAKTYSKYQPTSYDFNQDQTQEALNQEKLNDIFAVKNQAETQKQPEIIQENQATLETIEATLTPTVAGFENQTADIIEEQPVITIGIQEENQNETQEDVSQTDDFKVFYTRYQSSDINDDFLTCAYFIKNNLKLQEFTIKFLNSKLFQATGKIADMSTVEYMLSNDFLMLIETPDSKKYCITSSGEEHFAKKFQQ